VLDIKIYVLMLSSKIERKKERKNTQFKI
jgi:hypothetical protein